MKKPVETRIFVKGLLPAVILVECKESRKSGKEIREKIAFLTSKKWKPSPGTLYPLLNKMEKDNLLERKIEKKQVTYSTTKKGEETLEKIRKKITQQIIEALLEVRPLLMKIMYELSDEDIIERMNETKTFNNLFKKNNVNAIREEKKFC